MYNIPININQGLYIVTAVNFEEKKHLDLVNINAYTNFGKLLSVCSKAIERK